jgi:hypothetical protein
MIPTTYNTSPNPTQNAPYPTSSSSGHFSPIPIDLLAARYQSSPKEYQKRIDKNYYLYCGSFNYMAWDCPNKAKILGYPLCSAVAKMAQPETSNSYTSNPQLGNV